MTNLEGAIKLWLAELLLKLHKVMPGCVVAYYPDEQLADVEIRIKVAGKKLPIFSKIPVGHARTTNAFIHLPLKPGDHVQVLFNDEHTGAWRKLKGALSNAGLQDRHGLNGAMAIPCHYPDDAAITGLDPDAITVGFTDGTTMVITDSKVKINGALEVTGEVTGNCETAPVKLTKHKHPSPLGPTGQPIPEP